MKNKKFSVLLTVLFCALVVKAQEPTPPATGWEPDPLDVLEPKKQPEAAEPAVPQFTEVPAPGSESAPETKTIESVSPPPVTTEPALEMAPQKTSKTSSVSDSVGEGPDLQKEARFNSIYKKFNQQPTSVEAWEKAAGKRPSEVYQVQKGNTLWDISNTFFGDPQFWPKIWSLNSGSIGNPHEIDPSMSIRFYPGSMSDAPTVELGSNKEPSTEALVGATPVAAPPAAKSKKQHAPVLKNLPQSIPSGSFALVAPKSQILDFEIVRRNTGKTPAPEYLGYFLSESPVSGVGVVTAIEMDANSAGDFTYIYVQLKDSSQKNLIAQKNFAQIEDPNLKGRKAHMVEVQGEVEVLNQVNAEKNIYRAIVKKSIAPVEVGAVLVVGSMPVIDSSMAPVSSGVGAKIIGGQMGSNRSMFASNSVVFLNGGAKQGLHEGATLSIYADEDLRVRKAHAVQNNLQIGVLKILKVTENFSTAYVLKSSGDIQKGDFVGDYLRTASLPAADSTEQKDLDLDSPSAPSLGAPSEGGTDEPDLTL